MKFDIERVGNRVTVTLRRGDLLNAIFTLTTYDALSTQIVFERELRNMSASELLNYLKSSLPD